MALESRVRTDSLAGRIASEIKAELYRRGHNQSSLARALGESPMWVSERFTGKVQMTINDLARIAEVLGVKVADLLPSDEREVTRRYPGDKIPLPRTPVQSYPTGGRPPGRPAGAARRTAPTGR